METYNKMKGESIWAKNVKPEYFWHNGNAKYYEFGEKIENSKLVELNKLNGKISDPDLPPRYRLQADTVRCLCHPGTGS